MKKIVFTLFAFITIGMNAQTNNTNGVNQNLPSTPAPALVCNGNTMRSQDAFEKSAMFNAVGINLMKYDWSNQTINCHINEAVKTQKGSSVMKTIAWSTLAAGASLLTIGIMVESSSNSTRYYGVPSSSSTSGTPLIVLGALSIGTSIPLFIGGGSAKKKSNAHLQEVSEYYRQKGWFN